MFSSSSGASIFFFFFFGGGGTFEFFFGGEENIGGKCPHVPCGAARVQKKGSISLRKERKKKSRDLCLQADTGTHPYIGF